MIGCKDCKDQPGFVSEDNPKTGEKVYSPCDCKKKYDAVDMHRKQMMAADIPVKYWNYTIESYKNLPFSDTVKDSNEASIEELKKFMSNPKDLMKKHGLIWIWGPKPLAGHTILSVILAAELLKVNKKVKFLQMQNLVNMFTAFNEKREYFRSLENFDAFLLDSAFVEHTTAIKEYSRIQLYNWLKRMITREKFFICNSKVSIPKITDTFKDCRELIMGYATSLKFQGSMLGHFEKELK